jgi:hypothetical protein
MQWQDRGPDRLGYTERDFKVCDFCDALNPASNTECFVCGWNGMFRTDRETVREAMIAASDRYGGLDESLFAEEIVPSTPPRPSVWADMWGSLRKLFGRA